MTADPDDSAVLFAKAKAGDRDAYDRMFGRAADRALHYIRLRLGRKLRADYDSLDVLQETYLEAHRAFGGYEHRDDAGFARWLCAIAERKIHGLADHAGAKKRRPAGEREHLSGIIENAHSAAGPATMAERAERYAKLEQALDRLEPAERDALVLRYFAGMALDEIAGALGTPETTVRRTIARAAVRLGTMLAALKDSAS